MKLGCPTSRASSVTRTVAAGLLLFALAAAGQAETRTLALTGQSAPGTGGGTFSGLGIPALNTSGQATFYTALIGTADGSTKGIFRSDGATPSAIAREKGSAPGMGGGTFYDFYSPALNSSGQVAFNAALTGTTDGSTIGIFRSDGSTTTAIARDMLSAPGTGGGTFYYFDNAALNASGQAAFWAALTGTSNASTQGLFRGDGSTTTAIAREKGAAPGTGGGTFYQFGNPTLNVSGQAAFKAYMTGTGDGSTCGIFRGDGSTTAAIARQKWAAPGTGSGTFSDFRNPDLNASGHAAFFASLTGTSDASAQGIFRGDGGSLSAIARQMWAAPGTGGGMFNTLGDPALNASGQVAFYTTLSGTAGGTTDNAGVFLADDQQRIVAIRKGAALEGSTVTNISFPSGQDRSGRSGINDYAQVAYWAALADGRQGNFLFTPELHWRAAGSGSWDAAANWTVGIAPAAVHPVIIDPASSLAVAGPAGLTTVKSLTVGAMTAGQTATLNLTSATGALAVTGAAVIQPTGCINVDAGTLTAASLTDNGTMTVQAGATVTGPVTVGAATLGGTGFINGPVTLTGDSTLTSTAALSINSTLTVKGPANQIAGGTIWTAGDVTIEPGAVFIINGTLAGDGGALVVYGTLMGRGTINKNCIIEAGGVLSPGSPSTVQSTAQILNAQAPRNFSFEIGAAQPNYATPSNSLNDLVRLTSNAAPFADASGTAPAALTADTVIDVYFLYSDPALGEYKAQFFAATDFTDAIAGATFEYWRLDPRGSRMHNGNLFSPLDESLVDWSVVPETADFGGGNVSGYITQFAVAPEPATLALLAAGGLLLMRRRRRV
jgi:hypothetical protein